MTADAFGGGRVPVEIGRWWMRVVDPFGPNDVDPDEIRDVACEATSTDRVCDPPEPDAPPDLSDAPDVDLGAPGAGIGVLGQLLVVVLVAALLAGLVWLFLRWRGGRIDPDDDDRADVDETLDEEIDSRVVDHETPPDRWRRRAEEARGVGDLREAIRCLYRALVGDLARAGLVDEIPGRTSGEERAQVAENAPRLGGADRDHRPEVSDPNVSGPDVSRRFDLAADIFDSAWFDDDEVTTSDHDAFVAAERDVLDGVRSRLGRRTVRS